MSAAVTHFSALGAGQFEIWNEPNLDGFCGTAVSPEQYTELLKAAYRAAKTANPRVFIVSAGLAPAGDVCNASACRPKYFLDRMYKAGAKGNFDAFGIHPYYSPQPVDSTSVGDSNTWAATRPSQNERPLVAWHEGSTRWLRLARRVSGRDPDARVNSRLGERPTPV